MATLELFLRREREVHVRSAVAAGAFYFGQNRLRPRPFFYSGQFYLGQVRLSPGRKLRG